MEGLLISICIPSYRRPKEIQETIHSIVSQFDNKLKDMVEIIISDDANSNIKDVIEPFMKQYPNIHYFRNEKNMRFANGLIANSLGKGKYLLSLSNDDYLTDFSLRYLIEIIEKTNFDFLLHKPIFTSDVTIPVEKRKNIYHVYNGAEEYINGLFSREKNYGGLISYFSFNSVMVIKASYWQKSYNAIDKTKVFNNEFPQEFPPYYDLKDKIIVLADATFLKGRLLNASYSGTFKLIRSFQEVMDFVENQNGLGSLKSWKLIKKICIRGWNRTMYIGMILSFLRLNYKKKGIVRRLYMNFKKYIQ